MSYTSSKAQKEENERRKAALRAEISKYRIKLDKVISQITRLNAQHHKAFFHTSGWRNHKETYSSDPVTSEVVIKNKFEGVCADDIKECLSSAVAEMDKNYMNTCSLMQGISSQIGRLEEYKTILMTKIASLQAELASLG